MRFFQPPPSACAWGVLRSRGVCDHARHELSPCELSLVRTKKVRWTPSWMAESPVCGSPACLRLFQIEGLEDVYEQTSDERDREGGYLITVLRAIKDGMEFMLSKPSTSTSTSMSTTTSTAETKSWKCASSANYRKAPLWREVALLAGWV